MIQSEFNVAVKPVVNPSYYLKEYDDVLMGRRKTYSSALMAKEQGPRMCAELLRVIFKNYLHWSPEEIRDKLTADIVERMKLGPLVRRIPCPAEVDANSELYYVAWYLYPETRNVTEPELIIKLYTDVLNGVVKKFPGNYFDGNEGHLRARVLFLTMIREFLPPFRSIEHMYSFFASSEGKKCVCRYKLNVPLRELYGSALAFLHAALPANQKDEQLYERYSAQASGRNPDGMFLPVTEDESNAVFGIQKDEECENIFLLDDDDTDDDEIEEEVCL